MADNETGKRKVSHIIITNIVDMIKSGQLKTGDKLPPERMLTEQWGVSRASLREALAALEIVGLIEVRHGEGNFISDLNIANFLSTISPLFLKTDKMEADLLDFRRMLELESLKLVMSQPKRNTENLRKYVCIMREAIDSGDTNANMEADIAFHNEIVNMSENFILKQALAFVQYLMDQSVRFNVGKILQSGTNAEVLYKQHHELCELIDEGFGQKALKLLTKHIDFVKKV